MADEERSYPDLPVGQWWDLRNIFKSNLPRSINPEYIMSTLNISESTARNTIRNLLIMGLIDKDNKTTDRANEWRTDDSFTQVCQETVEQIYPQDLLDIARSTSDRNSIETWFSRKTKIGLKAARKNAAIFEVLFKAELPKAKESKSTTQPRKPSQPKKVGTPSGAATRPAASEKSSTMPILKTEKPVSGGFVSPSIHIDIQLHISPDAPPAQIEEIFKSIAKHLYCDSKPGE